MDDFVSAKLDIDYVGCRVQEWNGRKTLWCLCNDHLCNGESLKSLFYYGYGKGSATVGMDEPAETAHLEPMRSVDAEFDQMTGSLHNYNSHYALEPKAVEKEAIENVVEEPLMTTTETPEYMEPIEEPSEVSSPTDEVDTQFKEEFHQPDPHYFPPEEMRYATEPKQVIYPSDPDHIRFATDEHKSERVNTEQYPGALDYTNDPTNVGEFPPAPPYEVPVSYYYPAPGFHPYLSPYPPHLNTYVKQPDPYGPPSPPASYTKREDENMGMPEGKAGIPYPNFDKFGAIPPQDYQYNYQEGPADFELEPVSYFPYEENEQRQQEEEPELMQDFKEPEEEKSYVTQGII